MSIEHCRNKGRLVITGRRGGIEMIALESIKALQVPIEAMLQSHITIAPWLVHGDAKDRISTRLTRHISIQANNFTRTQYGKLKDASWTPCELHPDQLLEAYFEMVSSTAIYLSHIELGTLTVMDEMVFVAERIFQQFVEVYGLDTLMKIHLSMLAYENLQAVHYYREMSVEDFLSGHLHRPWQYASLKIELEQALASGAMKRTQRGQADGGTREVLTLTAYGEAILKEVTMVLEQARFLKSRSELMRLHGFNTLADYEEIFDSLNPTVPERLRRRVVDLCQIHPGMQVLELGCGTGLMTFNAGLFEAMGPSGTLVATDPAVGMLAAARRRKEDCGASWVEIRHARAEKLPFPDNSFDRVTGYLFLHFTDIKQALKEVARILKPGGIFTTGYPLHFPQQGSFFLEWFEPLLTRVTPSSQPDFLPSRDTVPGLLPNYFDEFSVEDCVAESYYTNPSHVVRFFVDIVNVFEDAMQDLPWQARLEMVENLIHRGEKIQQVYPREALVESHPMQLLWAKKLHG